jgi:hypothetical protein
VFYFKNKKNLFSSNILGRIPKPVTTNLQTASVTLEWIMLNIIAQRIKLARLMISRMKLQGLAVANLTLC